MRLQQQQYIRHVDYSFVNDRSFFVFIVAEAGLLTMFYCEYETIAEENESKLSSQGDIRTDISNTGESIELNLNQYIEFCEEPVEEECRVDDEETRPILTRTRSISLQDD